MLRIFSVIFVMMFVFAIPVAAQDDAPPALPPPQEVNFQAPDGLRLQADYWASPQGDAPAVLLLHQLFTTRESWIRFGVVEMLYNAGYHVLSVDLRGFGRTRGRINWQAAIGDVQVALDWLRAQPNVRADSIAVMGSSMGANLAIVGCANEPNCRTVVALSPGVNYFGVNTEEAIRTGLAGRSGLLVVSVRDRLSARGVDTLETLSPGGLGIQRYDGNAHGVDMLNAYPDLRGLIAAWLGERL
ncbi:MAG: alpha/beta fold hydrolase [Chloroflexi bacterium]|nr:MAG: alpha/beta fold hydrolase [Chloroflexota bacterium]